MKNRFMSGRQSIRKPACYGFAVFAVGLVVGLSLTHFVAAELVAGMPADDVHDSLWRDYWTMEYTLIGWFVTFIASSVMGIVVWMRLYDPQASMRAEELEQRNVDSA